MIFHQIQQIFGIVHMHESETKPLPQPKIFLMQRICVFMHILTLSQIYWFTMTAQIILRGLFSVRLSLIFLQVHHLAFPLLSKRLENLKLVIPQSRITSTVLPAFIMRTRNYSPGMCSSLKQHYIY